MIRKNAEEIGNLIRQFLRAEGLETPLNEYRAMRSWEEMYEEAMTAHYEEKGWLV